MRCPLVIRMNPGTVYTEKSWDERAQATAIMAEFALGDRKGTFMLAEGFEMVNLNDQLPEGAQERAFVDRVVAHETLKAWAEENFFEDRKIVLLGDEVAETFTRWAGVKTVPCDGRTYILDAGRADLPRLSLVWITHPTYIFYLRRHRSGKLRNAEQRYSIVGELYREGEAIILNERMEEHRQLLAADAEVIAEIIAEQERMLAGEEEQAVDAEMRREAWKEWKHEQRIWRDDDDDAEDDEADDGIDDGEDDDF